jgi:hypothetical protein
MKPVNIILLILAFCPILAYGQIEPRPEWVRQLPQAPPNSNFVYVYGTGIGATESDAELDAFKNALFYAFNESGLIGFEEQAKNFDDLYRMQNIRVELLQSIIPTRRVHRTISIYIDRSHIKVYILIKVQRDKTKEIDFNDNTYIEYESEEFRRDVLRYNKKKGEEGLTFDEIAWGDFKHLYKPFTNQFYFMAGSGITYGWSGVSFGGRHGSTFGIGYQLGLGLGYKYKLHYSGGFKLYPYRCFYISANYGTLGDRIIKSSQNDLTGTFRYSRKTETVFGSSFLIGADICFGRNSIRENGGVINIGIGFSPDIADIANTISIEEQIVFNIGIGYAF